MPAYWPIRNFDDAARREFVIEKLLLLRSQLAKLVPRKSEDTLLLCTWNIRDFDSDKFGYGLRLPESFHYIAEILNAFDLIAVQEVNRDLQPLEKLISFIGPNYDYILTDTTEGTGGNGERLAYVYDRRKVRFRKIAGEVVLPSKRGQSAPTQFSRTPFVTAWQAGWFKFNLCSVHIYYGADTGPKLKRRIAEIEALAKFFKERQAKEPGDYFLLGDFNIVDLAHPTMEALTKHGFQLPQGIKGDQIERSGSNMAQDKFYDQIVLRPSDKRLEIGQSGVLNFRESIFTDEDFKIYKSHIPVDKLKNKTGAKALAEYRKWLTWQMSDHYPLWVQLKVDFTTAYLESLKPGRQMLAIEENKPA